MKTYGGRSGDERLPTWVGYNLFPRIVVVYSTIALWCCDVDVRMSESLTHGGKCSYKVLRLICNSGDYCSDTSS